jgi:beta-xylosidase
VEGFYHDCSLLFDEDDRVYIVYGNRDIYITELKPDLSGPMPSGLQRLLVTDKENVILGYEGAHIYKINGKYYIFFIHWLADGTNRRVEACFVSDSLTGEFIGRNILDDDMGYHNAGVAQGGIVDTPDGDWYAILFQDYGAVGRIPVLVPMHWDNDFPILGVNGKIPHEVIVKSTRPEYIYESLVQNDDFNYIPDVNGKVHLKKVWQWNHVPNEAFWSVTEKQGVYRIRSGKLCNNVVSAVNTLTQRMMLPSCEASVVVDASALKNGDYAGICALQGNYGLIAVTKKQDKYYLVMLAKETGSNHFMGKPLDQEYGSEYARIPIESTEVALKIYANFEDKMDQVEFYYQKNNEWKRLGITHQLYFHLDHFVGCRFGLFLFSTQNTAGIADFKDFVYIRHNQ